MAWNKYFFALNYAWQYICENYYPKLRFFYKILLICIKKIKYL